MAVKRSVSLSTLGNVGLIARKLNGTMPSRPECDAQATAITMTGRDTGIGNRAVL